MSEKEVYHEQRFCRGQTRIHGQPVDLGRIDCPLLNLAASKDWIVPPASVAPLNDLVGSRTKQYVLIEGT